jgi:hypothetical protein
MTAMEGATVVVARPEGVTVVAVDLEAGVEGLRAQATHRLQPTDRVKGHTRRLAPTRVL